MVSGYFETLGAFIYPPGLHTRLADLDGAGYEPRRHSRS